MANKILNNTKEFGNISSINVIETPQNFCNSILESDCLLVKILNEQNSKLRENSLEKPPTKKNSCENEFRKQKYEKPSCSCNHEELLFGAFQEIKALNEQIFSLKNENEVFNFINFLIISTIIIIFLGFEKIHL